MLVDRAKARREVLLRHDEAQNIRAKRQKLDAPVADRLAELEKRSGQKGKTLEDYLEAERQNVALMNRKPVTVEVTAKAVTIRAKFQVRFEGIPHKETTEKFPTLKASFQKAAHETWSQKLSSDVMGGRALEFVPELTLISNTAARDKNFWLISVRPTDESEAAYEKTKFPTNDPLMMVTDPTLDGGVMSIPPKGIKDVEVLGHETLHLFGMVDRYAVIGKDTEVPLRKDDTDPLSAGEGKTREEDVGFALDALGLYPAGSATDTRIELRKVEEIIKTGKDPDSLIRERENFDDKIIRSAEDVD
jgi:hypothetical protein